METKTIHTQLLEFQKKIQVIKKDSKNPHFKNTYASLTQILSEVKPILSEVGIVLTQPILDGNVMTDLSYNGVSIFSSITLPVGLQPQPLGSAITYFRRYTLASLLALEIDDDDAQSTVKTVANERFTPKTLTQQQFEAMLKSINEGKKEDVVKAMDKYLIDADKLKALNIAIQNN
jgi:hypothetical protein